MSAPRVWVIGVPPGCKALGDEALEKISGADLLVCAERFAPLAEGFSGEVALFEGKVSALVDRVAGQGGLKAVFLASGDPGFFGIAALLARKLPDGEVGVLPAVSSLQAAFARLGVSWSDARFASLHGRDMAALAPVLGAPKVGLLTDGKNTPAAVAAFLVDAGWGDLEMAVCSELGEPTEKVERGAPADFTGWQGPELNVVVLTRTGPDPRPLGPGLPDDMFAHPRGRITKATVRGAALGLLGLPREGVLWDVGAGSGSVGIEAALLAPALRVFSVERDEEACGHIAENRRSFRTAGLSLVPGAAPEALEELPDPDRVFIGGSGGELNKVLELAFSRMKPGGCIVVSTVLVETFSAAVQWARDAGREVEWMEVAVSRSRATGAGTRLVAADPVTLIKIT